jgi:hypothetical protein
VKKVGIPYEMREGKLNMPPVNWPVRCPCCGSEKANTEYTLEHNARYVSVTSGTTTSSTYYPVKWQVPYCENCKIHTERSTNILYIIVFLVILSPIVLSIALGVVSDSARVLLLIIGSIIAGIVLYQILLRTWVASKMNKSCAHHRFAVFATDDARRIYFHFYRDEQAALFAQANNSEVMDDIKPNFWSLKKQ